MKREDIIRMARSDDWVADVSLKWDDFFVRFAALVAAAEREACAKVLDEMAEDMVREMEPSTAIAYVRSKAAAIRARGETK